MPLRLLAYITEMLLAHEKKHGLPLPPVLPFILHQGPDRWTVSTSFSHLFCLPDDLKEALLPFLPEFRHGLLDLSQFDPAKEEDQGPLRIVLQLMKLAREQRLLDFFDWLAAELATHLSESLLRTSLMYAFTVDSKLDLEQIYHRMESNRTLRNQTMSIAQKLIAQGRQEGREAGLEEGLEKGLEKGLETGYGQGVLNTCTRLARKKWGVLPDDVLADIGTLDYTQLEQLAEDILDLNGVADLQVWLKKAIQP